MVPTVSKERFLSNENNKKCFIKHLTDYLTRANILVKQALDDAGYLIVDTALKNCSFKTPVIVANDTDILVLLVALTPNHKKCYLQKPGKGYAPATLYSSKSFDKFPFCKKKHSCFTCHVRL